MHEKNKCVQCESEFRSKEELKRHCEVEILLANIDATVYKDLELKETIKGEKCLGLFSAPKPRDDGLANIFLHSVECWNLLGHAFTNLPEAKSDPPRMECLQT